MLKLSGSSDWFDDDSDSSTTSAWYSDVGLNRQPVANSLHANVDRGGGVIFDADRILMVQNHRRGGRTD